MISMNDTKWFYIIIIVFLIIVGIVDGGPKLIKAWKDPVVQAAPSHS